MPGKRQGESRASRDALQSSRHGGKRLAWCCGVSAPMDLRLVAAAIKSGPQTGAFCILTVDPVKRSPGREKERLKICAGKLRDVGDIWEFDICSLCPPLWTIYRDID